MIENPRSQITNLKSARAGLGVRPALLNSVTKGLPDCNPYQAEWQVLLDAIRKDKPHNEARRATEANIAALMGRMATHTGQYITCPSQQRDEGPGTRREDIFDFRFSIVN